MTSTHSSRKRIRKLATRLFVISVAATSLLLVSCVRSSGGTWYVDSAPLPEGWPELTPVGEVEIREYPTYRAAVVSEKDGRSGTTPMFRALFQHISTNDIPMTSPVDMSYETTGSDRMTGMAFLYRTPELGPIGTDGVVRIEDVPSRAYASTGVRGSYSEAHHREGLERVETWIAHTVHLAGGRPVTVPRVQQPFRALVLAIRRGPGTGDSGDACGDRGPVNLASSTAVEWPNRLTRSQKLIMIDVTDQN